MLLLDEPLSALDKKLRERTQFELMDLQYQVGTPSEIYEFPQSRFVADFVGTTNLFEGTVWELGYLGNRSTYQIKTSAGKLVTVFAQNERRTSEWSIDWSDEVYVSWGADAALLWQA